MDRRLLLPQEAKISGKVVSSKPVSLSRAAKIMSRFAAVDSGASPNVSMYVDRTADALNKLVKLHKKTSALIKKRNRPSDYIDSENSVVNDKTKELVVSGTHTVDEANKDLEILQDKMEKKKKKKMKMKTTDDDEADSKLLEGV